MLYAIDSDTSLPLSPEEAQDAQDNPFLYKWVRWVKDVPLTTKSIS